MYGARRNKVRSIDMPTAHQPPAVLAVHTFLVAAAWPSSVNTPATFGLTAAVASFFPLIFGLAAGIAFDFPLALPAPRDALPSAFCSSSEKRKDFLPVPATFAPVPTAARPVPGETFPPLARGDRPRGMNSISAFDSPDVRPATPADFLPGPREGRGGGGGGGNKRDDGGGGGGGAAAGTGSCGVGGPGGGGCVLATAAVIDGTGG